MNIKSNVKYIWLAVAVFSLGAVIFLWFGYESESLEYAVLGLNVLMFILSLPLGLFFVPVAAASNYYLEINALSTGGIYLNTFFLSVLGFMQWFWIARFWSRTESPFQKLDLIGGKDG